MHSFALSSTTGALVRLASVTLHVGMIIAAALLLCCDTITPSLFGSTTPYPFSSTTAARFGASRALSVGDMCSRHDESDSSIEQCQDWCKYPQQCEFCKCRACSMCKPCAATLENDVAYESCESWCSVPEHCSSCKCVRDRASTPVLAHATPCTRFLLIQSTPDRYCSRRRGALFARPALRMTPRTRTTKTPSRGVVTRHIASTASASR